MADFPSGVYSPRDKENKSGVVYTPANKSAGYAEDVTKLDDEVVAIETELGANPGGIFANVSTRLNTGEGILGAHANRHENGGADEISVADLSGELADAQTPKTHATSHEAGGSDELTDEDIEVEKAIVFIIDGGGSAITTGIKGSIPIPFKCEILGVTMVTDQSGSIVVDIWKDTYANYPPTDADSITDSTPPTISASNKDTDSTLTDWTKTITAGDILMFNVDSVATVELATLTIHIKRVG